MSIASRERAAIRAQIQKRRDALNAQRQQAEQQFNTLEQQLALLQRNIDAMIGGVQELDAQIAELSPKPAAA